MRLSNVQDRIDNDSNEQDKKQSTKSARGFCSILIIIFLLACGYLIYYFVINIKDPLIKDYKKVRDMLPLANEQTKQSVEQSEKLYMETKEQIENIQDKYEKVKETYESGKDIYEQGKEVFEKVEKYVE